MPGPSQATGTIRLNVVDGTRQPISNDLEFLIRILDGSKRQVGSKFVKGRTIPMMGLPYHDNSDDWYTIIIHADGLEKYRRMPELIYGFVADNVTTRLFS